MRMILAAIGRRTAVLAYRASLQLLFAPLLLAPATALVAQTAPKPAGAEKVVDLDWLELLPENERAKGVAAAPPPGHNFLDDGGAAMAQEMSFAVNPAVNGLLVKVPGFVVPLDRANIDTDQIIPKQFLKRVERTGFGQFAFYDWRFSPDGTPNPDFILNQPQYKQASILVASKNFGCGSSREHAPWALADYGFKAMIAPSFADIFYNNCFQNGILPVVLKADEVQTLFQGLAGQDGYRLTVDLAAQRVTTPGGASYRFDVDPFRKDCLYRGLDSIGLTLEHADKITEYEQKRRTQAPWLFQDLTS